MNTTSRPAIMLAMSVALAWLIAAPVAADHTSDPSSVAIVGNFQDELGCPGDWQPECASTELTFSAANTVWREGFTIPAGGWEYKAALNDSWTENYGAGGSNIPLSLPAQTDVIFYYSHISHWITDNQRSVIATLPGSFQSELGCPGDWQPECLASWLQDPDQDGIYSFTTASIPTGTWEVKVAHDESWVENYGAGGVQNGPNIPFQVINAGLDVVFDYDPVTHILTISGPGLPVELMSFQVD